MGIKYDYLLIYKSAIIRGKEMGKKGKERNFHCSKEKISFLEIGEEAKLSYFRQIFTPVMVYW